MVDKLYPNLLQIPMNKTRLKTFGCPQKKIIVISNKKGFFFLLKLSYSKKYLSQSKLK